MENKIESRKTKVIIFSKSQTAIRAEPALSLYGDLLPYYPLLKFFGITFDNRMTFTKHFEEILECSSQKFHHSRVLVNKKWGPSPTTILQIYKQCVRPIFEYGIASIITVSESIINEIQRTQNSFVRLVLHLPKYLSARLLHEALGLPYVRERLITVAQNHLARMHANPLIEHTINSARINIAWNFVVTAISTAVNKPIPKSKSECSESNPISDETIALIKRNVGLGDNTLRSSTQLLRRALTSYRNKLRITLG